MDDSRFLLGHVPLLVAPEEISVQPLLLVKGVAQNAARFECDVDTLEAILQEVDGERTLDQILQSLEGTVGSGPHATVLRDLMGLGIIEFPGLFDALEAAIPHWEITRYPWATEPRQTNLVYWRRMGLVRADLGRLEAVASNPQALRDRLCHWHRLLAVGDEAGVVYSGVTNTGGSTWEQKFAKEGVGAFRSYCNDFSLGPTGGLKCLWAAKALKDDFESRGTRRHLTPSGELLSRAEPPFEFRIGFESHPRGSPRYEVYWDGFASMLAECLTGFFRERARPERALHHLAGFHQAFICGHPFTHINQSLAMNIVNHLLRQSLGRTLCHAGLDEFAFVLSRESYSKLFAAAYEQLAKAPGTQDAEHLDRVQRFAHDLDGAPNHTAFIEWLGKR
jgi:hypothetical protein